MTDREKEAIERCNELIKVEHSNWIGISNQVAIETVLNLLNKQQEVIATEDKIVEKIVNTIVGDKQLLSRICNKHIKKSEEDCEKQNLLCDDCIKMYLLNKVEKEKVK